MISAAEYRQSAAVSKMDVYNLEMQSIFGF